jgi:hypothetical protein
MEGAEPVRPGLDRRILGLVGPLRRLVPRRLGRDFRRARRRLGGVCRLFAASAAAALPDAAEADAAAAFASAVVAAVSALIVG